MKKIKSTVTYKVPHWNYCNCDDFADIMGKSKRLCQFCIKTKAGYSCTLYNCPLSSEDGEVSKTRECCKATAGFPSNIDALPPAPTIDPKELMSKTIQLYNKTVQDFISQGYPRSLAEDLAKRAIMDL